jgi:hypothetical protein
LKIDQLVLKWHLYIDEQYMSHEIDIVKKAKADWLKNDLQIILPGAYYFWNLTTELNLQNRVRLIVFDSFKTAINEKTVFDIYALASESKRQTYKTTLLLEATQASLQAANEESNTNPSLSDPLDIIVVGRKLIEEKLSTVISAQNTVSTLQSIYDSFSTYEIALATKDRITKTTDQIVIFEQLSEEYVEAERLLIKALEQKIENAGDLTIISITDRASLRQ